MAKTLEFLGDFVHEAQRERGLASLYLRAQQSELSEKMEAQFAQLDSFQIATTLIAHSKYSQIEPFLSAVGYLRIKRKNIISRQITPFEVIAFYSRDIIAPAINIIQEIAILEKGYSPTLVSALINFLQWKERIGIERALGAQYINSEVDFAEEIRSRLSYLVKEQRGYERMFMALADDQIRSKIHELEKNSSIFQKIDLINRKLDNEAGILSNISATEWFNLFSAKMDILHEIGRNLTRNLEADKGLGSAPISNSPAILDYRIDKGVRENLGQIRQMPLFCGIDETLLLEIVMHARLVTHTKGSTIFLQGEQANRFYVILDGWVKLFKGDVEGHESILQMLSSNDALLETTLLAESKFPINAQAVETTRLLSMPASLLREKMRANQHLTVNLITTIAEKSQELINQFEQLTLKSVGQRVGWFLLRLYLAGGENGSELLLPYDKALIAGYLGMKPETFSRTLQTLRACGITSELNLVRVQDPAKLCDFCDFDLQEKCKRKGTNACKKADCMVN